MSFKICSIGCGQHATRMHGPSLRKYAHLHPDVVLAACCDIDQNAAEKYKKEFGFQKIYLDIDEMLKKEKPDAVSLVAPVDLTAKLAAQVMRKGFPLILEKPPGRNAEETKALIEIAEKNDVPNQVAVNRRYSPLLRKLKQLLDENLEPEEIHDIRCDFFRVRRADEDFSTTAIHGIDAVRFLSGSDFQSIRFRYQELPNIGKGVANIFMDCTFKSGAAAHINILPVSGTRIERYTVNAYDHTFFVEEPMWFDLDVPGRLIHRKQDNPIMDVTGEEVSDGNELFESCGFYYENKSFFDCLRSGKKPQPDLKSVLQSVEVAECLSKRCIEYHATNA